MKQTTYSVVFLSIVVIFATVLVSALIAGVC